MRANKLPISFVWISTGLFSFSLAFGAFTVSFWLATRTWTNRCPSATFLLGWDEFPGYAVLVPVLQFIWWTSVGVIISRWFFNFFSEKHSIDSITRKYHYLNENRPRSIVIVARNTAYMFLIVGGILMFPSYSFVFLDEHCVYPEGVSDQPIPWTNMHRYQWIDVDTLKTECHFENSSRSTGEWDSNFVLLMKDGSRVNLGGGRNKEQIDAGFIKLAQIIRDYPIKLDNSGIDVGCTAPTLQSLTVSK